MDIIAMYAGYILIFGVFLFALIAALDISYKKDMYWVFKILGFGFVNINKANTDLLIKCREMRKDENAGFEFKNSVTFINAPTWFNQYVYNTGVVK
jgi:uncharacterized membrane protein